jgi:hypothetical protein
MFQGIFHTITMPLDKWKTFQCGVRSTLVVRVRGFEAYCPTCKP